MSNYKSYSLISYALVITDEILPTFSVSNEISLYCDVLNFGIYQKAGCD